MHTQAVDGVQWLTAHAVPQGMHSCYSREGGNRSQPVKRQSAMVRDTYALTRTAHQHRHGDPAQHCPARSASLHVTEHTP